MSATVTQRRATLLKQRAMLAAMTVSGGAARRYVELCIARRDAELAEMGVFIGEGGHA